MTASSGRPPERSVTTGGAADDAIAVIGAYGLFRLLLILLAVWSFFAGFALLTQGFGAISFGGADEASERILGAHMLILAPVYGLIAWRREQYRLLIWLPYAAQLAIILPSFWDLTFGDREFEDGALLLVVSIIFLALLVYLWTSSHPLGFFDTEIVEEDDDDPDAEEWDEDEEDAPAAARRADRDHRASY